MFVVCEVARRGLHAYKTVMWLNTSTNNLTALADTLEWIIGSRDASASPLLGSNMWNLCKTCEEPNVPVVTEKQ